MRSKIKTAMVLVPAACLMVGGCGDQQRTRGTGNVRPQAGISGPSQQGKGCSSLAAADFSRVAAVRPASIQPLAQGQPYGYKFRCGTAFIDGGGQMIALVTQAVGSRAALAAFRRAAASELGPRTVRAIPSLGAGAFVARRELGFLRNGQLVILQTGYSQQGRLQLSDRQLVALANLAGPRL